MTPRSSQSSDPGPLRICLFGGTFDPVHLGHLAAARSALDGLQLDRVIFLPCRISPHKLDSESAPAEHRLAMLELALRDHRWAHIDRFDLDQPEPSYSWRTALAMRERHPDARLFWLVGGDQWDDLPAWKNPGILAETLEFIVVRRGREPLPRPGWTFHPLTAAHPACATTIRESAADRLRGDWLAPGVADYIRHHRLYGA